MKEEPPPRESSPLVRIDEVVRGFTEDAALYPVLAVVVLIFATLAGAALVLALQRNVAAMGAVAGLVVLSAAATESDRRRRRIGPTSVLLLAFWVLAGGGAALVHRLAA